MLTVLAVGKSSQASCLSRNSAMTPSETQCTQHNYSTLQYITLRYITLHYVTLHYIALQYNAITITIQYSRVVHVHAVRGH